jgi:hypothetical protein
MRATLPRSAVETVAVGPCRPTATERSYRVPTLPFRAALGCALSPINLPRGSARNPTGPGIGAGTGPSRLALRNAFPAASEVDRDGIRPGKEMAKPASDASVFSAGTATSPTSIPTNRQSKFCRLVKP